MAKNSVFEKNVEVLAARYPDLAAKVRYAADDPSFMMIKSRTGKPNILVKRDSKFL